MKDSLLTAYNIILNVALMSEKNGKNIQLRPKITVLTNGQIFSGEMATQEEYIESDPILSLMDKNFSSSQEDLLFPESSHYIYLKNFRVISGESQTTPCNAVLRINVNLITGIMNGSSSIEVTDTPYPRACESH